MSKRKPGEPLRNVRQEKYAHARAQGATIEDAQETAGYAIDARNGADLLPADKGRTSVYDVRDRIRELVQNGIAASELKPEIPINILLNKALNSENEAASVSAAKSLLEWLKHGQATDTTDMEAVLRLIRSSGDVELEKFVIRLPGLPPETPSD